MGRTRTLILLLLGLCLVFSMAGCKKKPPPPPPATAPAPPPPPPPKPAPPTVTLSVEPSSIERGQSATLRWSSKGATEASINQGIGTVATSGSRQVFPSNSTTYTINVKGEGGTASASASVTVRAPAPPPPPPPAPKRVFIEELSRRVQDIYFDFDKFDIRDDARGTLNSNGDALRGLLNEFPSARVVIEGHCDERGSAEYNLGLGDRRANAAKEFLVQLGLPADRLNVISYGKERPQCTESTEECWQRNRRAHFTAGQ